MEHMGCVSCPPCPLWSVLSVCWYWFVGKVCVSGGYSFIRVDNDTTVVAVAKITT